MNTKKVEPGDSEEYIRAKRIAKKQREFYSHLRTYIIVNALFFIINLITAPGEWWILFPVIGWGFCLAIHAVDALSPFKDRDNEWEKKKTEELIRKYRN